MKRHEPVIGVEIRADIVVLTIRGVALRVRVNRFPHISSTRVLLVIFWSTFVTRYS